MALPKTLVYNDLTGEEVKHVLTERFISLLNDVPYLQRHITLPRVRMTLEVHLDCWAEQKHPERKTISDALEVRSERAVVEIDTIAEAIDTSAVIDASPKGEPPDKIRETYGLGVPTPIRGQIATEDFVEGRRIRMDNGAIVDRTGQVEDARPNATVVTQDFGPARERTGRDTAPKLANQHRGGDVAPVNWGNKD